MSAQHVLSENEKTGTGPNIIYLRLSQAAQKLKARDWKINREESLLLDDDDDDEAIMTAPIHLFIIS